MRRRLFAVLAIPALLSSLACSGVVDASFEACRGLARLITGSGGSTVARAVASCGDALANARLYEDVPAIDERTVRECETWYGSFASDRELSALACMAKAQDPVAWGRCRSAGVSTPAEQEGSYAQASRSKMAKVKGNKVEINVARIELEIAESAGVLGALRDGTELDGVFGTSSIDTDLTGGIGGLIGAKGVQIGSGGLGSRGSGLGGGGTAEGLGTLGTGGGGASGYGSGGGNLGAKGDGAVTSMGDPIILGALDKSLIDAVIKRHLNQIRYCYQRELTTNTTLSGAITVKFVVAKDGTVASAATKRSTMGNEAVESCINSRFMRMQFPEPKGGGIVIVSYPFQFSP